MTVGFELVAGGATSGSLSSFWLEEVSGPPSSPLQKRGRLYAVAEGATHETEGTIKAIRDGYFGDIPRSSATIPSDLRLAIEAANSLLYSRGGIGVSCVCAVVYGDNELAVQYLGDGRAYLLSTANGMMQRLTEGAYATKTLGTRPKVDVGETHGKLEPGDILMLCSGSVVEAIGEQELADIASTALDSDVKRLAQRIISRATAKDPEAEATAIVVACRPTATRQQMELDLEPEPLLPRVSPPEEPPRRQHPTSGQPLPAEPKLVTVRRLLMGVGRGIRTLLFLALLLVMAVAIFLGYRLFQSSNAQEQGRSGVLATGQSQPYPTTSPIAFGALPTLSPTEGSPVSAGTPFQAIPVPAESSTTPTPTSAEAMKRIDALWALGDQGSVAALEEIVGLLEEQRKQ
ncbi:MAG: SpoIIE family protein phosphatase, partial [Chloroflexi bacterium]|nr:SpoIIE family protein phosphatase [Chloroflexota bacterium]